MSESPTDDVRQMWETLASAAGDDDEDAVRRSIRHSVPRTLSRVGAKALETLPPLNPRVQGRRTDAIEFVRLLDSGGMGEIYVARQKPLGRRVAVKRLRRSKQTEKHRLALLAEGWITGRLQHPNIVPVYTLGQDDDQQPAIVMKLIEGVTLAQILQDFDRLPNAFASESQLESHLEILIQICNALSYTHDQGFIHRDIKPSNIMVGAYGEVYLVDWGIAMPVGAANQTMEDQGDVQTGTEGTPAYMAPEMAAPTFAKLSKRTDIFLLGACLHEILTGESINAGDSYFDVLSNAYQCETPEYDWDVPEPLRDIATRAMSRDPSDRYPTVVEFRDALRDFLNYQTSWRLAEVASSKLTVLEQKIDGATRVPRGELYPLFGACKFGFLHALDVRSKNATAREGLQRAVELMVDWELRHHGASAAEVLMNSLPEPNPELARRVDIALVNRRKERQKSLFTHLSPDAVVAVDANGEIAYTNERTTELFGYEPDELRGEKVEVLVPQRLRHAHVAQRDGYMDQPTSRPMGSGLELEGVHKDGSRIPIDISLAPVDAHGQRFVVASIRQLEDSEADFEADVSSFPLLDALKTPICMVREHLVVWCNRAFAEALDYDGAAALKAIDLEQVFPKAAEQFPRGGEELEEAPMSIENTEARDVRGDSIRANLHVTSPQGGRTWGSVLVEMKPCDS